MTGAHPVAFYLHELSGDPARRGRALPLGGEGGSDLDLQLADAHARGVLEGRAAAQAEQDAVLAKRQSSFDSKLAEARQQWAGDEGKRLADGLAAAVQGIEHRIADVVSQILKPVVLQEVRARAIEELKRELADLLARDAYTKISITGPQDLLAAIEAHLGPRGAGVSFVPSETVDVTVRADEAVLETRMNAWAVALDGGSP